MRWEERRWEPWQQVLQLVQGDELELGWGRHSALPVLPVPAFSDSVIGQSEARGISNNCT